MKDLGCTVSGPLYLSLGVLPPDTPVPLVLLMQLFRLESLAEAQKVSLRARSPMTSGFGACMSYLGCLLARISYEKHAFDHIFPGRIDRTRSVFERSWVTLSQSKRHRFARG